MKKRPALIACLILLIAPFPLTAFADIGPKPGVIVDFKGLEGKTYYVTLLSQYKSTGPFSALEVNPEYPHYKEGDEDYSIFLKFVNYQDSDGYYFLQYFQNCTQNHRFNWGYYPPVNFKILIYFPTEDTFISVPGIYKRYAFDSYFTVEATLTDGSLTPAAFTVSKSYPVGEEIFNFAARAVLTILLEISIAFCFRFGSKKFYILIICINALTQVFLNFILSMAFIFNRPWPDIGLFIFLETLVFGLEAVLYAIYAYRLKKMENLCIPPWKPIVYALTANAASLLAGYYLAKLLPGMF